MVTLREVFSYVVDENPGDAVLCSTLLSVSNACLLSSGINPASLDSIVTLLEPSIRSSTLAKRTVAMKVMEAILQTYADNLQPGYEVILLDPNTKFKLIFECVCSVRAHFAWQCHCWHFVYLGALMLTESAD